MNKTINATDAVRAFSEVLNSVKYRGDHFTIVRGGKPAAAIVPVDAATAGRTLGELRRLVKDLPSLGEDSERFALDIENAIGKQPQMPENTSWE